MERLLADAEKISGVHYDIDNYDDVIQAIHVMQTEMGITGTTAEEASQTISGSLDSMSAAWDNWLTGLATTDMDMTQLTEELVASIETAMSNVLPAIQRIAASIVTMIAEAFGASDADIQAAFDAISQNVQIAVDWIVAYVLPVVDQVWNAIKTAVGFIVQVFQAAWPIISMVIEQLSLQWQNLLGVVGFVADGISGALNGILPVIQGVLAFFTDAINKARSKVADIVGFVTSRFNFLASQVRFIFNKVKAAITQPIEAAKSAVKRIVDTIKGFFSNFHISLPKIKLPHFSISPSGWQIGDLLKGSIPSLSISWYAKGGIVDGATLIGAGEAGPEAIVPLSGGYMRPFAAAIADEMGGAATYNIYLNDVAVNDSQGIREVTAAYLLGLKRLAAI